MEIGKHYKSVLSSTLGRQFSSIYQHTTGTLHGSLHRGQTERQEQGLWWMKTSL